MSSLNSWIADTKFSGRGPASGLHMCSMIPVKASEVWTRRVDLRRMRNQQRSFLHESLGELEGLLRLLHRVQKLLSSDRCLA